MKQWIGRWLIVVSLLHSVVAVAVFGGVFSSIIKRGVFNTVGTDPMTAAAVWFVLFGAMLFTFGLAIAELEKSSIRQLPKSIGWSLLAIGIVGIILMPVSGFWLVFPPAIAVLMRTELLTGTELLGTEQN